MDLIQRPRRLRGSETLRKMVRETRIDKSSLIYPLFVKEGTGIEEEIPSMEGQYRMNWNVCRKQESAASCFSVFQIIKMKWAVAHMMNTELFRKH